MISSTNTDQDVLISPLWKKPFSLQPSHCKGSGVPSLVWICLQCIAEFPDQVQLHHKLVYQPSQPPLNDTLTSVLTGRWSETLGTRDKPDLSQFNPRVWAVIAQIFDHLPVGLRTYTISLNDEALPLLQRIPNTATFSLMTILELPGCVALTDSSISQLKDLHTLTAFDASSTQISSYGLLSLARTLQTNDPLEEIRKLRGPWTLRILRLKHCTGIDNAVYATLLKFPLLSVVDLRGTNCHPRIDTLEFPFFSNVDRSLFSSDMVQSLSALQNYEKDLRMHSAPKEYHFALRIKTLCHETIAECLNQKENHFRPLIHHPSRISRNNYGSRWTDDRGDYGSHWADDRSDYDSHWTDDRSDQHSQQSEDDDSTEESAFDDIIDELRELGGRASEEWEERASDDEVDEEMEGRGNLDENVTAAEQSNGLPERGLNESQKATGDPLIQPTMMISGHKGDETTIPSLSSLGKFRDRRKPHWYDADWARENTYVPMSLANGKHDNELMLYRPARPWNLLESELNIQLAKEARREQVRTDGYNRGHGPSLGAPPITKSLQVQEDMKSMATEALRRRQISNTPAEDLPSRAQSRNPFARKSTEVPFAIRRNHEQPKGKPLKPISALPVPQIARELLQQTAEGESYSAGSEKASIKPFTITKNHPPSAKLPTKGSLAHGVKRNLELASFASADPRGESSKRKTIRRSEAISMSSGSMAFNPGPPTRSVKENGRGKGKQKTQLPSFNWAAWASKKT